MHGLADFLKKNAPWLAAGGLLTFGSSFGQTYFISLFAGEIRAEFGLSHGEWGALYAMGTLASAALMLLVGGLVDGYRTRSLAVLNLCLFAVMCLCMALVPSTLILPLVIFGLRFCGQGVMSHLAIVSVGRWFAAARGRAISIVSMGFSIGEAVMPYTFVLIMGLIGWRMAWGVAAVLLLAYIPLILVLLRAERSPRGVAEADSSAGMQGRYWTRGQALRHWLFWVCVPGLLAQPIFGTAFFFQQVHLVELKGWTLAGFTQLMPIYTGTALVSVLVGGALVDRFGTGRLMPFYLLPMAAGFWIISETTSLAVTGIGIALIGAMQGMSAAILGAFWPEYYGTRYLGAIRSVATSLMVFATALGPAGTGFLIDRGVSYDTQLKGMALIVIAASVIFLFAFARARRLLAAPTPA
ncbi:MFS transporter [Oceanibium sediminis]|uniref:MFS transporter n=1 Tax=Oceanibium sediminis TaxID=2026339 RepID=UPI000DD47030|nr:MFS transporter [Oceanibium sediminis]